jgi:long-chain acyl-CoA synthetase
MIISGARQIRYPEIHERIAPAAAGFDALGLRDGAPVAMMLRNDFALFEVSIAAGALGTPVVPINWHLKAEEVSSFKAPKDVRFLDALPREATGKIFKRKLRDPFWEGHVP